MKITPGDNYLITADNWFTGPDGDQYQTVYGPVFALSSEETLGIRTNAKSTNWYLLIGTEARHVIIAGCQIHYACKVDNLTKFEGERKDWSRHEGKIVESLCPYKILDMR